MNFGMEARLDGSQRIAVETQQVMAMHLHIYYFISALRVLAYRKPALSLSLTHTHNIQLWVSKSIRIQIINSSPEEIRKTCVFP